MPKKSSMKKADIRRSSVNVPKSSNSPLIKIEHKPININLKKLASNMNQLNNKDGASNSNRSKGNRSIFKPSPYEKVIKEKLHRINKKVTSEFGS